jgi:aspartate carbamoyltransferase catalytic subunit
MASKMASKALPATRHVVSINDLSDKDIETIFDIAQAYLKQLPDKHFSYRIGRSTDVASSHILASLFYEPSTRTRLSFESAMIRLGGQVITSADPATSSAAKGESLADTVRVIANYADIMVIRHPRDGAARLAAEYSPIPVINGGDGSHEHPTQTLCDLFTLKQKNKRLKNLKVAISGDLKGSRTIHSFVYALARFGATIMPMPAKGMELPAHVDQRLREEFGCHMVPVPKGKGDDASIDALYVTPEEPHQQSLFSGPEIERDVVRDLGMVEKKVDALYVTRFQKERWAEKDQAYPRIDRKFLNEPKYAEASVMHPLPRVGELDVDFDSDRRAVYFEQAAYGVPIRMALISLLLGLKGKSLHRFEGGFEHDKEPIYDQPRSVGIHCSNPNCIVHDPMEAQYVRNKFHIVQTKSSDAPRLRCVYCEREIEQFVVANKKSKSFVPDPAALGRVSDHLKDIVLFADEADAQAAGFHSRRSAAEPRPPQRAGGRAKL